MNDREQPATRDEPPAHSGINKSEDWAAAQENEALRRALASATADARGLQQLLAARQRELDQLRGSLTAALGTLRTQLEGVQQSAAWRYGHAASRSLAWARGRRTTTSGGVAAAIGQVDRALELVGAPTRGAGIENHTADEPSRGRLATRADRLLLGGRVRDALGPVPPEPAGGWPPVVAIVVSRSADRLTSLLAHLAETDYPGALRVIVIDNASPGGAVSQAAAGSGRLTVQVLRLEPAVNFAAGCNAGAQRCGDELLLFLNDDVEPIEPGWLLELVACAQASGGGIVGATLVDPHIEHAELASASGWTLEQRGITIGGRADALAPVRRGAGSDVFAAGFGTELSAIAVSAACMLVPAAVFAALGSFDTGYQYGLEDVDLCLRARARGTPVVGSGRAVVVHLGSGSQREAGREFRRVNHAINHRRLRQVWGPELRRARLEGLLRADPAWGPGPHLGIARTSSDPSDGWGDHYTAQELGEAAASLGWRVTFLAYQGADAGAIPDDLDLAVVLADRWDARAFPARTVMFAWVRNWTERWLERPWLERYDVLLASSRRSATLLGEATGRPVQLFPLASNPRRFRPPRPGVRRELDWAFTGNRWGEPRAIEPALAQRRSDAAAIYGRGWDKAAELLGLARGPVAYDDLAAVYGTAKVVLDDTAEPTLIYDAVNARVFDALACGALVLSNCERGVRELFDDEFPTWSTTAELGTSLDQLLAESAKRDELATRYRAKVLSAHTYEHRARELRRLATVHNRRPAFCLKIGAPDTEQARLWGDLHFATALGRALRRLGHRWRVETLPEWDSPAGSYFDVVVHLRGRSDYAPAPGQFNVLWLISHPDELGDEAADRYDLVCVASAAHAERLRERISTPVRVLDQATDPWLFYPDSDPALAHELVFVGNSRGTRRKILDDLLPTRHDLAIWGSGWGESPAAHHLRGRHVANDELRRVYSSASIVLCDHWPDMRASGFGSNRLYDAVACGALVVSDRVAGLNGAFGAAVATYEHRDELEALLTRLLDDPAERERRVDGARERILAGETFDHRARDLLRWVQELRG